MTPAEQEVRALCALMDLRIGVLSNNAPSINGDGISRHLVRVYSTDLAMPSITRADGNTLEEVWINTLKQLKAKL